MPSRRHLRLTALVLALGLLGAACGDDDSTDDPTIQEEEGGDDGAATDEGASDDGGDDGGDGGGSGDVPDPCELVTIEDIEGWFGPGFDPGELSDDTDTAGQKQCTWGGIEGMTAKVVSITVATEDAQRDVFPVGGAELFEQTRAAIGSGITEEDAGLGDDSFGTGSALYVLDGDTTYTFTITGTSEEARAGLRAMAEHVVDG